MLIVAVMPVNRSGRELDVSKRVTEGGPSSNYSLFDYFSLFPKVLSLAATGEAGRKEMYKRRSVG